MQEGFLKSRKNQATNTSAVAWVGEYSGKIHFQLYGETENADHTVSPEYEQEWRDKFDLHD